MRFEWTLTPRASFAQSRFRSQVQNYCPGRGSTGKEIKDEVVVVQKYIQTNAWLCCGAGVPRPRCPKPCGQGMRLGLVRCVGRFSEGQVARHLVFAADSLNAAPDTL